MKMKAIKRPFYFGASPEMLKRADILRKNMTETELLLWKRLNAKQINHLRFRAQHPIDKFVVDFFCPAKSLIIEIDGNIHSQSHVAERDEGREIELKKLGLTIIRFTNDEVLTRTDNVIARITLKVNEMDKNLMTD
jgi:very-short-patch-repair endonuclease